MAAGRDGRRWKAAAGPCRERAELGAGEAAPKPSQPMGGDALIEVAFDNVGTKRLMLKSASAHMSKVST